MLRTDIYPCTIDNFMLAVLSNPNSPPHSMNRLKRLAAILLSPTEDLEQAHAALEAAGVPVSFADCRNCPNPCEDGKRTHSSISSDPLNRLSTGHEEYPQKIASMIDTTSDMLGSVKPYRRQVRPRSLSRNVILCVDGFLTKMFGRRDAAFFIESLLKVNVRDVFLFGNVPGWQNAYMVPTPFINDGHCIAIAPNNQPLRLLDFVPRPMYRVVPQKIWTPPKQSDRRRYVEQASLRMPVFFIQNDGAIGLPLPLALSGEREKLLCYGDSPAPLGMGHSTKIRIAVPLFLRPSSVSAFRLKHGPIAVAWVRIMGAPNTAQGPDATAQ